MSAPPFSRLQRLLLGVYDAAHHLGVPALRLGRGLMRKRAGSTERLRKGFERRMVPPEWGRPQTAQTKNWHDIWLHAASGGEAYLAWELLRECGALAPKETGSESAEAFSMLATSCTDQGYEVLHEAAVWARKNAPAVSCTPEYFPFDAPSLMRRALMQTLPKAVVLLETEIWPGLLAACAREGFPVLVINGRMTTRSLARYLLLKDFLRRVAPARILAISDDDAGRFAALFGADRVGVMPNMKFDRFDAPASTNFVDSPIASVFSPGESLCVLGSVRDQEEPEVCRAIVGLQAARPRTCIALFPRHMERVQDWGRRLDEAGIPWCLRSTIEEPVEPGAVVLWDRFGELGAAYGQARAAFVGGSLAPLGGQNFLEPLAEGVIPVIGPHWSNFAWVGQEIVEQELVRVVQDGEELARELVACLESPPLESRVKERFQAYIAERKGGSRQACAMIREYL